MSKFQKLVKAELKNAMNNYPPFNSEHEGIAVILEEFEELKSEVWKKQNDRDFKLMLNECVQLGAMAERFAQDCLRIK